MSMSLSIEIVDRLINISSLKEDNVNSPYTFQAA
jgi:hypothetical protein